MPRSASSTAPASAPIRCSRSSSAAGRFTSPSSGRRSRPMADALGPEIAVLLTELVEKMGLLRRDMQQKGDLERYEARIARIEQKFSALAEYISQTDPDRAKAL